MMGPALFVVALAPSGLVVEAMMAAAAPAVVLFSEGHCASAARPGGVLALWHSRRRSTSPIAATDLCEVLVCSISTVKGVVGDRVAS